MQVLQTAPEPVLEAVQPDPQNFAEIAELAKLKREAILRANIINNVHLVRFEPGRIEVALGEHANRELPYEMSKFLSENTSQRWVVTVSNETGEPTLRQQWDAIRAADRAEAAGHPLVKAVLETFPGASVGEIRPPSEKQAP